MMAVDGERDLKLRNGARGERGDNGEMLNDRVREAIREAIVTGRLKPGDRLVEGKLAIEYGVSRNPVREALKALDIEGIVTISPRRGAVVPELSEEEAGEVIELRAALEALSARLAARRLRPEAAEVLEGILAEGNAAAAAGDYEALFRLNDAFHAELVRSGSNRFLADFMRSLRTKTHWLFTRISRERALESWNEHAQILRAVLDRDEEMAGLLASRHVTRVGKDLMRGPVEEASGSG